MIGKIMVCGAQYWNATGRWFVVQGVKKQSFLVLSEEEKRINAPGLLYVQTDRGELVYTKSDYVAVVDDLILVCHKHVPHDEDVTYDQTP